jgi:hypothetical protein
VRHFFSPFQIDEELSSVTSPIPSFPRRPNFSALLLSATSSGLLFLKLLDCFSKEVAGEMRSIFFEAPQPPAVAAALLRFFFSTLQRLSDFLTTQQLCLNLRASETRMIPSLLVLFMLHTRMLMIFVSLLHLQLGLEDVFTSQAQRASKSSSPSSAEHPLPVILLFDRGVCDVSGVTQSPFFKLFFCYPHLPPPPPSPSLFHNFLPPLPPFAAYVSHEQYLALLGAKGHLLLSPCHKHITSHVHAPCFTHARLECRTSTREVIIRYPARITFFSYTAALARNAFMCHSVDAVIVAHNTRVQIRRCRAYDQPSCRQT